MSMDPNSAAQDAPSSVATASSAPAAPMRAHGSKRLRSPCESEEEDQSEPETENNGGGGCSDDPVSKIPQPWIEQGEIGLVAQSTRKGPAQNDSTVILAAGRSIRNSLKCQSRATWAWSARPAGAASTCAFGYTLTGMLATLAEDVGGRPALDYVALSGALADVFAGTLSADERRRRGLIDPGRSENKYAPDQIAPSCSSLLELRTLLIEAAEPLTPTCKATLLYTNLVDRDPDVRIAEAVDATIDARGDAMYTNELRAESSVARAVALVAMGCAWAAAFVGHPDSVGLFVDWILPVRDSQSDDAEPLIQGALATMAGAYGSISEPPMKVFNDVWKTAPGGVSVAFRSLVLYRETVRTVARALHPIFTEAYTVYTRLSGVSDGLGLFWTIVRRHVALSVATAEHYAVASETALASTACLSDMYIGLCRSDFLPERVDDALAHADPAALAPHFTPENFMTDEERHHVNAKTGAAEITRARTAIRNAISEYGGDQDANCILFPTPARSLRPSLALVLAQAHRAPDGIPIGMTQEDVDTLRECLRRTRVTRLRGHSREARRRAGNPSGRAVPELAPAHWVIDGSVFDQVSAPHAASPSQKHVGRSKWEIRRCDFDAECVVEVQKQWRSAFAKVQSATEAMTLFGARLAVEDPARTDDEHDSLENSMQDAADEAVRCTYVITKLCRVAQLANHALAVANHRAFGTSMITLATPCVGGERTIGQVTTWSV